MPPPNRCYAFIENTLSVYSDQDDFVAEDFRRDAIRKHVSEGESRKMIGTLEVEQHVPPARVCTNVSAIVGFELTQARLAQLQHLRIFRIEFRLNPLLLQINHRETEWQRIKVPPGFWSAKQHAPTHQGKRRVHVIIYREVVIKGDAVGITFQYCR